MNSEPAEHIRSNRYPHYITMARGVPAGYPHAYGYAGACIDHTHGGNVSVGVFAILRKAHGNGLKRGPVLYRTKAAAHCPEIAFRRAEEYIAKLEHTEATR